MDVGVQTYWLYTWAACSLVWGALGLRFAASVLAANALLALILFTLGESHNSNLLHGLMFCYPLYWGMAFALLGRLDTSKLPALNTTLRFFLGVALTISFVCGAQWEDVRFSQKLFHATFIADVEERPGLIRKTLRQADSERVCNTSHAWLMKLAMHARDKEVVRALQESFATCPRASLTMQRVVKPLIDNNDTEEVAFLLQCGFKPSSLVFGTEYANGTALAYAAIAAKHPDMVRLIAGHDPQDARRMKYFDMMVEALYGLHDGATLDALVQAGVLEGRNSY